jgi:hypothetical protein
MLAVRGSLGRDHHPLWARHPSQGRAEREQTRRSPRCTWSNSLGRGRASCSLLSGIFIDMNADSGPSSDMPLPSAQVQSPASNRKRKRITSKYLPLALSTAAVVVSLLNYADQHGADRAAAISAEESYAVRVSFWLVNSGVSGQLPEVAVQNDGVLPISNALILIQATSSPLISAPGTGLYFISVREGTLPPCAIYTAPVLQLAKDHIPRASRIGHSWSITIESLRFTDASGLTWTRSAEGTLSQSAINQSNDSSTLSTPIPSGLNTEDAPGCN